MNVKVRLKTILILIPIICLSCFITVFIVSFFTQKDQSGTAGSMECIDTIRDVPLSNDGYIIKEANTNINDKVFNNLEISEEVGSGNVFLTNVTVKGSLLIEGGGENSVILDNCTLESVFIRKQDGKIRVLLQGDTSIGSVEINTGCIFINDSTKKEKAIGGFVLSSIPLEHEVKLGGNFNIIGVTNSLVKNIFLTNGSIQTFHMDASSNKSGIVLDKNSVIGNFYPEGSVNVTGEGKIKNASVSANGVDFQVAVDSIQINPNIKASVKDKYIYGDLQMTEGVIKGLGFNERIQALQYSSSYEYHSLTVLQKTEAGYWIESPIQSYKKDNNDTVIFLKDPPMEKEVEFLLLFDDGAKLSNSCLAYISKDPVKNPDAGNNIVRIPDLYTISPIDDKNIEIVNISFVDKAFEGFIRQVLSKPEGPITNLDALSIREICITADRIGRMGVGSDEKGKYYIDKNGDHHYVRGGIQSLKDLKWFTNIEFISVSLQEITSAKGVEYLVNAKAIHIEECYIKDVTPFSEMYHLNSLGIGQNLIEDVSSLKNLRNLKTLIIEGNLIEDVSSLSNLKSTTIHNAYQIPRQK